MIIEQGPRPKTKAFWRRLSLGFLVPLTLVCAASTTMMAFDIFEWRGSVDQARGVLDNLPSDPDLRRRLQRQAIGAMNRDWNKSRERLIELADGPDELVAKDAANTLRYIHETSVR